MNKTTLVTAFFDIGRENNGDGRKLTDYLEWLKKTLQLNCHLFIVTEAKFVDFMWENRPAEYKHQTFILTDTLANAHYYKYLPQMREILASPAYKARIAYPNRVECTLPEYNIIQYSKFGWLAAAIQQNPFQSDYFFWLDAGISRFFLDTPIKKPYPGLSLIQQSQQKFIIQPRHDLQSYSIDDQFIWTAENLMKGTMFGGYRETVLKVGALVEQTFREDMLLKNNVNNEQLTLALVYKKHPELFFLTNDDRRYHLVLFKALSL